MPMPRLEGMVSRFVGNPIVQFVCVLVLAGLAGLGAKAGYNFWWIALVLAGLVALSGLLEKANQHGWVPFVWLGFGKHRAVLATETDQALADRVKAVVTGVGGLLSTYHRYQPESREEGSQNPESIAAWTRGINRRQKHEQETAALYFERYNAEVLDVATGLRQRGAMTEDDLRSVVWFAQTAGIGSVHELPRILAMLSASSRQLLHLDGPAKP
jgi:hypothetical protein